MIVITGAPGAGKSIQSALLEKNNVAKWLSVGKLLRAKLPPSQRKLQKKGDLIDDAVVTGTIKESLKGISRRQFVILDGFPRRDSQVKWLFSNDNPRKLDGVIYIDVPEDEAIKRLLARGREDDTKATIKHRYDIFHAENRAIMRDFAKRGVQVESVDGTGSIEQVHKRIAAAVRKLSGHRVK